MINANELRKGVIIRDYTGHIREVSGEDIQQQCWHEEGQTGTLEAPLNPIELTPEWLERCGLEENEHKHYMFRGVESITTGFKLPSGIILVKNYYRDGSGKFDGFIVIDDRGIQIRMPALSYIHQLQNAYFVLTGQELQIKMLPLSLHYW
jgi:hypothetical protein